MNTRPFKIAVISGRNRIGARTAELLKAYEAHGATVVYIESDVSQQLRGVEFSGVIVDEVFPGELGTFENMRLITSPAAAFDVEASVPRIQHGPVRKGRGGKPKRW